MLYMYVFCGIQTGRRPLGDGRLPVEYNRGHPRVTLVFAALRGRNAARARDGQSFPSPSQFPDQLIQDQETAAIQEGDKEEGR
jgi:hypothetical protein